MLSLWPLEQFIFEIRVLQNKTIEFARTSLSYRPNAALSTGVDRDPRKTSVFAQIRAELFPFLGLRPHVIARSRVQILDLAKTLSYRIENVSVNGRPTGHGHALQTLISLERDDQFTSGLLCPMSPSNHFRIWPAPIPVGACHGTWHVPRERVSETRSPWVTPRRLARLRSNLVCD